MTGGDWQAWLGREQGQADWLDPALAWRWLATFDLPAPHDDVLPQGIHFCLCTPEAPTARLGPDGHPLRDDSPQGFFPPIPLPRRMWAASAIHFHQPLRVGAQIERRSRIASIAEKDGASGRLAFVDVDHVTLADGVETVRETQTLVYREAAAPDAPLSPPGPADGSFDAAEWDHHRAVQPDAPLLFRYSALTFNTHRIHYDAPYASAVERYRGLVVHGPLIASLLLQLAEERYGGNRLVRFAFRGLSPAIAGEPLHLVLRGAGDGIELAAFASDGRQVTRAEAALA